ncbi:MAG: hypothetical protein MUD08_06075 [Cytophagales bacterium]|nr:hypothetical protein [Cytophagales bacterium]
MNKNLLNRIYRFALLLGLLYPATLRAQVVGDPQLAAPAAQPLPSKSSSKVSSDLVELQNDYQAAGRRRSGRSGFEPENSLLQVVGDRVVIDAVARGDVQALRAELERRGMTVTAVYGRVVSGLMPITSIREMESVGGLQFASPAYRPATNIGAVTSQGDSSMRGGIARRRFGVDGLGNKIGVMSNSYNLLGGADAGVRSGDLPGPGNPNGYTTPVQVLREFPGTLTQAIDEGRGMAELVHDVAPGAQMAFRTAFLGQADFAQGITELANAGCNIIVDDVIYFAEPFFQDGIIAQSVDAAQARGVTYLSSAGNQARASYESEYRPSTVEFLGAGNGTAHNFSAPGAAPRYNQPVFIPRGGQAIFSFQWDDSFFSATGVGAQSDLDIYLLDSLGTVVAGSAANNLLSGEPVEIFGYTNNTPRQTFFLVILKFAGPDPRRLKYINFGSGAFFLTNPAIPGILSSTLVGHANAAGAIATGASFASAAHRVVFGLGRHTHPAQLAGQRHRPGGAAQARSDRPGRRQYHFLRPIDSARRRPVSQFLRHIGSRAARGRRSRLDAGSQQA